MKSMYELLIDNFEEEKLKLTKEMSERLKKEWDKINNKQMTLIDGRERFKQKYPDINDLIAFIRERGR